MGTFEISSYISVKVYNEIPVRILHIFSEILSFPGTIIITMGVFTSSYTSTCNELCLGHSYSTKTLGSYRGAIVWRFFLGCCLALGSNPEVSYMKGAVPTTMNSTYHLDTTFSKLLWHSNSNTIIKSTYYIHCTKFYSIGTVTRTTSPQNSYCEHTRRHDIFSIGKRELRTEHLHSNS